MSPSRKASGASTGQLRDRARPMSRAWARTLGDAMLKNGTERRDVLRALGEVFRAHGYEGASLTLITEATGLGKGSLYHLFPGGKEQMAAEVLADIDAWFELNIYAPLREASDPARAIAAMIAGVDQYFRSGDRVCLVGLVALGASRDTFAQAVDDYFA